MKKELTQQEKDKRETLLTDISSKMVSLLQDFDTDSTEINEKNFPWKEDLQDVFHGKKDTIAMYSRSLHDYFEVEPVSFEAASVFPMFDEGNAFDTLNELYASLAYLVLEKRDLLTNDEKLR